MGTGTVRPAGCRSQGAKLGSGAPLRLGQGLRKSDGTPKPALEPWDRLRDARQLSRQAKG